MKPVMQPQKGIALLTILMMVALATILAASIAKTAGGAATLSLVADGFLHPLVKFRQLFFGKNVPHRQHWHLVLNFGQVAVDLAADPLGDGVS